MTMDIDESLLPLFQMEAESQCVTLSEGVMALEAEPKNQDVLDRLMRAAHALKGAAAVVGLDAAVQLAHAMEDCFTAAMKDAIVCEAHTIDMLLQATDTLSSISTLDMAGFAVWQAERQKDALALAEKLHDISVGKVSEETEIPIDNALDIGSQTGSVTSPETTPKNPRQKLARPAEDTSASQNKSAVEAELAQVAQPEKSMQESSVRLSSQRLDTLVGLSGEVQLMVQDIAPVQENFIDLQRDMAAISLQLQGLRNQCQQLPQLKRSVLALEQRFKQCRQHFGENLDVLYAVERKTSSISQRLSFEVLDSRMQKFGDASASLRRLVWDTARGLGKSVRLDIVGEDCDVDRDIMEKIQAPIQHILRNAVDHGVEMPEQRRQTGKHEEAVIRMQACHLGGMLHIRIEDDGQGIDLNQLRQSILDKGLSKPEMVEKMRTQELLDFLLLPQFSMKKEVSHISGRGVGLDLVANTIRSLRGQLKIRTKFGKGSDFDIHLPLSLSIVRCLLVAIHGETYGIHLTRISSVEALHSEDIHYAESRPYMHWRQIHVGLISASQVLGWPQKPMQDVSQVIVFAWKNKYYGLMVDAIVGESAIIEKKLDARLGKIKNISTGAVDTHGQPLLVLDMDDVLLSIQTLIETGQLEGLRPAELSKHEMKKSILIVEDSITVREAERRMLENRGYQVRTAVDGMDGWNALRAESVDLVISDIDMPRMNGLELLRLIRSEYAVPDIPVMIVSYKDRQEDRLAGMQAGANYYLTKSSFHDNTMLQGVLDLIGEAV